MATATPNSMGAVPSNSSLLNVRNEMHASVASSRVVSASVINDLVNLSTYIVRFTKHVFKVDVLFVDAQAICSDISSDAMDMARNDYQRNNITEGKDVQFLVGDLYDPLKQTKLRPNVVYFLPPQEMREMEKEEGEVVVVVVVVMELEGVMMTDIREGDMIREVEVDLEIIKEIE